MTILDRPAGRGHWALATLGGVIALLGAVLLAGGVWPAALGGSWYYAPAGAAMLVAGVLLFRGRNAGAWWFAGVVAVSLLWTWWESGSDYWRWVPRLGLIVGLALVLALLLPKLQRPVSRTVSRSLAGALAVVFVVAFALAFMPHGVTEADGALAHAAGVLGGLVTRDTSAPVAASGAQPANAPADGDWAAYGRSQAGQRYSPLHQHHGNHLAGSGRLLLGGVLLMLFQRLLEHGIATLQRFQFQRGGRRTRLQLRQRRLIAAKAVLRAGKLAGFGTQLAATYERQPGSDQRPECECRHQVDQDAHGDSSKRCISCRPATRRLEADPWRVP
ncbi:hypothetical protein J167_02697 [Xanthomonas citri pv. citri]|nr:hypothetical protein J166_02698 [Xanthomonas citri pv. citri]AJZ54038.1 hypothetical protein J167_02697 [Xanthomonas citri pv. citri]AJZ66832.1 hypothetical protein J168_02696 [Xanthomonas citri pv. citri]CEE71867.1 membrane hypothetical protein [Xanthomonas citri pv. citri]CEE84459.1 membrane hypothetical protein [Xanthomonas citri pv. citri]